MFFAFFSKSFISFLSKVDFDFLKPLTTPKPIFALDAVNKIVSKLKSCFINFLTEFSSATGWTTLSSNDKTASFSFSYKKNDKGLSVREMARNGLILSMIINQKCNSMGCA